MSKNAPKVHEWEGSKSGIRKHYRKILYPTAGVALAGTTTAAIVLPIMIKKMAEEKFAEILPIGGPVNSLRSNVNVAAKDGKVNYVAIGDSVTAGYNGYMSSNDVVRDAVKTGTDAHGTPENTKALLEEIDALEKEIATLKAASNPDLAKIKAKEDIKSFLEFQMEDGASHTTKDYLSYADFVANDLAKANKLNDYRNFALTGATVPNLRQTVLRNTTALAALQNADLISISIGANDLLAAVEVLRLSFNSVRGEADTDKVSQFNIARNAIEAITKVNEVSHEPDEDQGNHRATSPSAYASEQDTKNLIKKSFYKLVNMLNSGSLSGLLDIEQELLNNIFSLIQLDTATAINEIHKAAPDAKIVLMGYAFPFHLLPSSLIDTPIVSYDETKFSSETTPKTLDGHQKTLREVFMTLIDKLKGTVERANYVKFFDINSLKEFTKDSEDVTYNLEGDANNKEKTVTRPEWDRVMPNPLDIHPSTYGHQVIAGHLYEWIARDLGLNVPDYQSVQKLPQSDSHIADLERIYTYAGIDKNFDIKDEKAAYDSDSLVSLLKNLNDPAILKIAGLVLQKFGNSDYITEHWKQLKDDISNIDLTGKTISEKIDAVYPIIKPALKTSSTFGNVQGFTAGQFFDRVIEIVKSVHWDKVDLDQDDKNGLLNDIVFPSKGDGIQLIEMLMVFSIYLGDDGQAKTLKVPDVDGSEYDLVLSAHEAPIKNDEFTTSLRTFIGEERQSTYRDYIEKIRTTGVSGVSGNALLKLVTSVLSMDLTARETTATSPYILNLVERAADGSRQPWISEDTTVNNLGKLMDEVTKLGTSLGMDISGLTNNLSDRQKTLLGLAFWLGYKIPGSTTHPLMFDAMLANSGFDVSSQTLWGKTALSQLTASVGLTLNSPFEQLYPHLVQWAIEK